MLLGRYTRNIRDYELLVPHKVDQKGNFVSFHLPQFFQHNFVEHRKKRDFSGQDAIQYKLFFNGKDHTLQLLPNQGFVAPNVVKEYHYKNSGRNLNGRRIASETPVMCYYTGRIRGLEGSRVAISTCDGLVMFKAFKKVVKLLKYIESFERILKLSKDIEAFERVPKLFKDIEAFEKVLKLSKDIEAFERVLKLSKYIEAFERVPKLQKILKLLREF